MNPTFFATPAELRAWLEQHHADAAELWVGFYKKGVPKPSVTYAEAVDEALCFGWIDGVRKSLDAESYANRFTPRRRGSHWSAVNIAKVEALRAAGRMAPAGEAAFAARDQAKAQQYSYEERSRPLDPTYEEEFRSHTAAWEWFAAQPPSYRRTAQWWVMSAVRQATQRKRLAELVALSAQGVRLTDANKL